MNTKYIEYSATVIHGFGSDTPFGMSADFSEKYTSDTT